MASIFHCSSSPLPWYQSEPDLFEINYLMIIDRPADNQYKIYEMWPFIIIFHRNQIVLWQTPDEHTKWWRLIRWPTQWTGDKDRRKTLFVPFTGITKEEREEKKRTSYGQKIWWIQEINCNYLTTRMWINRIDISLDTHRVQQSYAWIESITLCSSSCMLLPLLILLHFPIFLPTLSMRKWKWF